MTQGEGSSFSFSTVENFDAHIAREIRGYDILDTIIQGVADAVIEDRTNVYDIGCSTGRLLNALAVKLDSEEDNSRKRSVNFIGLEPNINLVGNFEPATSNVEVRRERVTAATQFENASLITSIFTLQFVSTQERPGILQNIYKGLCANGAFIWAEKIHSSDTRIESLINGQHLDFKQQGSTAEDILAKDRRLRSIMRPLDMDTNLRMLQDAGFNRYEPFWRVNNFMALIAIKSY